MTELTERQHAIWTYIRDYQREQARPPTMREIGDYMRVSSLNGVHEVIAALEKKGWVRRIGAKATPRNVIAIRPNATRDMEQATAVEVKIRAAARDAFLTGTTLTTKARERGEAVFDAWWLANRERLI